MHLPLLEVSYNKIDEGFCLHVTTETKVGVFVVISIAVFTYLAVHLGIFRFNVTRYQTYEAIFDNVNGLNEKSEVKIAGVKVGWIDSLRLPKSEPFARVKIKIKHGYQLHDDAYVIIRQEGVIGSKYLEVVPGSPDRPLLPSGSTFTRLGESPASIDALMQQCKTIAERVTTISGAISTAVSGDGQQDKLQTIINNLATVSEKLVAVSDTVHKTVHSNEQAVNTVITNLSVITDDLRTSIPQLKETIERLAGKIENGVIPTVQTGLDGIVQKLTNATDHIEQTVQQARDGITHANSITQKLDNGTGLLGKLINDDKVYNDVCQMTTDIKEGLNKFNNVGVDLDFHSESMSRAVDCYCYPNNKGYFDIYYKTGPDWFYKMEMVTSEQGWPDRVLSMQSYNKENCTPINPDDIVIDKGSIKVAPNTNTMCVKRNNMRVDVQMGKVFKYCTLRAGTFEHTFGLGVDVNVPFNTDALKWVSTLELFDLYGQNRVVCDRRPHLKWLNRLVLFNTLYVDGGLDDCVSKCCSKGFYGIGLRFSDDDLKHVASKLGFLGMGS